MLNLLERIHQSLRRIEALLVRLLALLKYLTLGAVRLAITIKGVEMASITITDSQAFVAHVSGLDAKGNPAALENVTWAASDPALLTVTPSTSDNSVTVAAVGPTGQAQVTVTADALIGEGEATLNGILDVAIVAGQATSLGIGTEAPTEQ